MSNPYPQCDGIWKLSQWEVIRSQEWNLMNGIIAFIRETHDVRTCENMAICEPGSEPSPDIESARTLILDKGHAPGGIADLWGLPPHP